MQQRHRRHRSILAHDSHKCRPILSFICCAYAQLRYERRLIESQLITASRAGFKGQGPGPQASHRQRASHQTLHILLLAHDSLVLMHACVRQTSARLASFIDQFIDSLDQRLQFYKLLAGQFGCFGCLSTLFPEELLTAAKTLIDSYPNDLDNSFVDELCHLAKFVDIFKDDGSVPYRPQTISATTMSATNHIDHNHISHTKRPYRPQWITMSATGKMYCYLASTIKIYPFETQNVVCNPVSRKCRVKELNNNTVF